MVGTLTRRQQNPALPPRPSRSMPTGSFLEQAPASLRTFTIHLLSMPAPKTSLQIHSWETTQKTHAQWPWKEQGASLFGRLSFEGNPSPKKGQTKRPPQAPHQETAASAELLVARSARFAWIRPSLQYLFPLRHRSVALKQPQKMGTFRTAPQTGSWAVLQFYSLGHGSPLQCCRLP